MKLEERTFGTPCRLPDIFYFFHSWKEGRRGRTLKGKEQYVKGKATKRRRKDAFRHCKQRTFSADVTMSVFYVTDVQDLSVRL